MGYLNNMRIDDRRNDELRDLKITDHFIKYPAGSVLMEMGNTKVICTAMVEEKVPPFLYGKGKGWITAEYNMIPGATHTRKSRDIGRLKLDGRTTEVQRLIGRTLRSIVDLTKLGERSILIDCDVIQADGGTRTASINGAYRALRMAVDKLLAEGVLTVDPIIGKAAAVSVGIVNGTPLLDLCYEEDSTAEVDMNIVMNDQGEFIEIQGTGEARPFRGSELTQMLALAQIGIWKIFEQI